MDFFFGKKNSNLAILSAKDRIVDAGEIDLGHDSELFSNKTKGLVGMVA